MPCRISLSYDDGEKRRSIRVRPTKEQLCDYIGSTAREKPMIDPFMKLWKEPDQKGLD